MIVAHFSAANEDVSINHSSCWSRTIAQNMSEHKACRKTRAFCKPPIHKRLHTCTLSRGPSQLLIQVLTQCAFRDWFPMWSDPRYFSIPQPITSTTNSSAANFWIGHRLIGATPSHDHRTVFPGTERLPFAGNKHLQAPPTFDTNATQYKQYHEKSICIWFRLISHHFRYDSLKETELHIHPVNVAHQVALPLMPWSRKACSPIGASNKHLTDHNIHHTTQVILAEPKWNNIATQHLPDSPGSWCPLFTSCAGCFQISWALMIEAYIQYVFSTESSWQYVAMNQRININQLTPQPTSLESLGHSHLDPDLPLRRYVRQRSGTAICLLQLLFCPARHRLITP